MDKALPRFVPPMLAVLGRLFDSEAHFFELKWDGIRVEAFIESGGYRLMSRNGIDITDRYPTMGGLASLPKGLLLDGELVAFREGRPDFGLIIGGARKNESAAVGFVAFDILYKEYDPLLGLAFSERRKLLEEVVHAVRCRNLLLSEGVRGAGGRLFQLASEKGLEGVMAKRLSSAYASGKRSDAWVKIKRRLRINAAIIGYIENAPGDFKSLLVAASGLPGEPGGPLRYVGKVGGGFDEAMRTRINGLLKGRQRRAPLVPCGERACWIEPGLYCMVSFAEITSAGMLRAPVFEGLVEP